MLTEKLERRMSNWTKERVCIIHKSVYTKKLENLLWVAYKFGCLLLFNEMQVFSSIYKKACLILESSSLREFLWEKVKFLREKVLISNKTLSDLVYSMYKIHVTTLVVSRDFLSTSKEYARDKTFYNQAKLAHIGLCA